MNQAESLFKPGITREGFIKHIRTYQNILDNCGTEIAVVGGMAVRAYLGEPLKHIRANGTLVDFDAIALGPDKETVNQAILEVEAYSTDKPDAPEAGIEPVAFDCLPTKDSFIKVLSGLRREPAGYSLTYGDIEVPIPEETMQVKWVDYDGLTIPTLPAKTIWWRYLLRGGQFKPKDFEKMDQLQQLITTDDPDQLPDSLYQPYLEFALLMNQKHPHKIGIYNLYWAFDKFVNGYFSGSKGQIYGMIKHFRPNS